MSFPKSVKIVEVAPRDGLQNEKQSIDTSVKIELIEKLTDAGIVHLEAGSFVNPKWVPQMAGSEEVFQKVIRKEGVSYAAPTPNMQGYERAIAAGATEVAVFGVASNTFAQKNTNCTIAESIERIKPIMETAKNSDIPVRGYISCIAGCPYEGEVSVDVVVDLAKQLYELGCYEISLGDTIGVATPGQITNIIQKITKHVPVAKLAVHFHDTYGQALANIYAALQLGVSVVDGSVAGLGGCPYAKGASGNAATEDIVYMLNGLGIECGLDLEKLIAAGQFICEKLDRCNGSKVALARTK